MVRHLKPERTLDLTKTCGFTLGETFQMAAAGDYVWVFQPGHDSAYCLAWESGVVDRCPVRLAPGGLGLPSDMCALGDAVVLVSLGEVLINIPLEEPRQLRLDEDGFAAYRACALAGGRLCVYGQLRRGEWQARTYDADLNCCSACTLELPMEPEILHGVFVHLAAGPGDTVVLVYDTAVRGPRGGMGYLACAFDSEGRLAAALSDSDEIAARASAARPVRTPVDTDRWYALEPNEVIRAMVTRESSTQAVMAAGFDHRCQTLYLLLCGFLHWGATPTGQLIHAYRGWPPERNGFAVHQAWTQMDVDPLGRLVLGGSLLSHKACTLALFVPPDWNPNSGDIRDR